MQIIFLQYKVQVSFFEDITKQGKLAQTLNSDFARFYESNFAFCPAAEWSDCKLTKHNQSSTW